MNVTEKSSMTPEEASAFLNATSLDLCRRLGIERGFLFLLYSGKPDLEQASADVKGQVVRARSQGVLLRIVRDPFRIPLVTDIGVENVYVFFFKAAVDAKRQQEFVKGEGADYVGVPSKLGTGGRRTFDLTAGWLEANTPHDFTTDIEELRRRQTPFEFGAPLPPRFKSKLDKEREDRERDENNTA